jgi:hypothetical protein
MGMGMGMRVKFYHSVLGILFGVFFHGVYDHGRTG